MHKIHRIITYFSLALTRVLNGDEKIKLTDIITPKLYEIRRSHKRYILISQINIYATFNFTLYLVAFTATNYGRIKSIFVACTIAPFLSFATTTMCTRYSANMNPKSLEEALVHWAPGSRELELWFSDYIELPANAFIDYGDTEEISFHVFSVKHIEDGAFNGLSGLKRPYLPRSMITEVRKMTFSGLISLEILYLGQNRIAIIADEAFIELGKLKKLNLEKNNLSLITRRTLNGLRNLEHFDLSHNQLKSLESEMFGNTLNLKVLKLSNNMISTIEPGAFKGLRVIDSIELNDNYLQVIIPGTFQDLSSLKHLNLSKNRIVDLETRSLGGLTGLLDLQLKENMLSSVEKRVFAELPRPLILDIRNNPLLCNQNQCWIQREIQKKDNSHPAFQTCLGQN